MNVCINTHTYIHYVEASEFGGARQRLAAARGQLTGPGTRASVGPGPRWVAELFSGATHGDTLVQGSQAAT